MRVNVLMTVMVRDKIVGNSRGPVSIFCVFVFCAFEDTSSGDRILVFPWGPVFVFVFVYLRTLMRVMVMVVDEVVGGRSQGSGQTHGTQFRQ